MRLVLLLGLAQAAHGAALGEDCLARVRQTALSVAARSYPSLAGNALAVEAFRSDFDFFQARVHRGWGSAAQRVYVVRVNEKVCADPLGPAALEGVLAHELAHLDSYTRMSRRQLIRLAWTYLTDRDGAEVRDYERATDRAAARAGYAEGLIAYRDWMIRKVSPSDAKRKEKTYLSPDELRREARVSP